MSQLPPSVAAGVARIERIVEAEARRQGVQPDAELVVAMRWLRALARAGLYAGSAEVPQAHPRETLDVTTSWVTSSDLSERLGVTPRAVRKAALNGRYTAQKIGRIWWIDPTSIEQNRQPRPTL